ncbi:MAG: TAXI family TRAP transporter solute-binding subunit [Pirellulales bacterium]
MKTTAMWAKKHRKWLLIGAGLLVAVLAGYQWLFGDESQHAPIELIVSPGSPLTSRHYLADLFARHSRTHGVRAHLVETKGSEETLDRLERGTIDVGFISGGFRHPEHCRTVQLATVGAEPLHFLVKPELALGTAMDGLSVLRGKRVHVGIQGSGVFALSTELLAMAGLKPRDEDGTGDYEQLELSHDELWALVRAVDTAADAAERKRMLDNLPDAIFLLHPLPAVTATELMEAGYALRPLPYAESFKVHGARASGEESFRIERRLVRSMKIPACTYGLAPANPVNDVETIGVSTIVVARPDLPSDTFHRLIKTLYESPFASDVPPPELSALHFEYAAPASLQWYFESRSPVVLRDFVETVQNGLSVFGAFSAGVFTVYGYYRRRRGRSAETYAAEIGALEHAVFDLTHVHPRTVDTLESLQRCESELAHIKRRLLEDYTHGRLPGDHVFSSLLSLISDARASIVKNEAALERELSSRRPRRAAG